MHSKKFTSSKPAANITKLSPLGLESKHLVADFKRYYGHRLGRDENCRSPYYAYEALALAISDRLIERWKATYNAYKKEDCKRAFYLSMEFLMGRTLSNAMLNLGVTDVTKSAMYELGLEIEELIDSEPDAGLGNGGLGRLAACFIDSCATLQLPVTGYGLRYEYGMFTQTLVNGEQVERPDHWLRNGNIWEIERPEYAHRIKFGGHTESHIDERGKKRVCWIDTHDVLAVPFDTPIPGYKNGTVNTLRLWKATATEEFDLQEFNAGDYAESVAAKNTAENITMVLYPNDANENGKALRLRQQYLLASASLQDVIANWVGRHGNDFSQFAEKNCFQLNDTHPSIAVAELMRLLIDIHGLDWDQAWKITRNTMAYTNHTLLPEALERWSVSLFESLLPRLLEIIYEINSHFIAEVSVHWPGDHERMRRMSLIEEGNEKQVRMAYLAIVGSYSVNGVAELHSKLLQEGLFKDFHELWPHKFNNKTNGVTPRRWLAACNPDLAKLISETIGDGWLTDLAQLEKLKPYADDPKFREKWYKIKQECKSKLVEYKRAELGVDLSTDALFDVQVKRIHEYKRQLLNVLHVIHLYDRIKRGETKNWTNRCVLIGGKAAPGYYMAKKTIKFINNVADVINNDPDVGDKLKLVFLPNYRVSAMEKICPGADLSEQISTAGKEASGTGNMKFMMNGALTIGTLDGANIEIREEVGDDNFFLFGLTEGQVEELRSHYDPVSIIEQDEDLKRVLNLIECGHFSLLEPGIFDDVVNSIRSSNDPWMTVADFRSYVDAQNRAEAAYLDKDNWTRMSILNCASSGKFSTDRTISDYNREIWKLTPVAPLIS
ncbi:MAG: glycogen/starch/alpha-glucan phosphorylase [Methylicorpusculum sp.]|uniref:glycogen/starch/alpha-glucan phosphorylase n=1 Tax=Methylicorpusculum sp. TaxID=2713644 RepID=UPI002719E168|nr:glycogen/starch/alpha-glucan phosphorylase [Methylicorpusculum sp.]MDO8845507.1 glycogen/starch/alpha-glucan phosphorylase [Methylicorpusculum sp.]MDO8938671.1 glycogen/starch/alpha-glucan phosphorylase [Methylicorpusculum sp.]MDP2179264.1 glycogen/starch/alpha-glucan phosphorylase [Methylicorpusculum sp.]MDP2200458.1 glycogen/starch/alpha-glucan phosphorylase [Methylicorpusculum sp.]MDP3530046.1 glycogen/starch/alpha-glucan phosphorylase [Methylicorpusculum sp.]